MSTLKELKAKETKLKDLQKKKDRQDGIREASLKNLNDTFGAKTLKAAKKLYATKLAEVEETNDAIDVCEERIDASIELIEGIGND